MRAELPVVTFRVSTDVFPAEWHEMNHRLKASPASRSTKRHPTWRRIDGRGFTIWLSDVTIADSTRKPPVWEVRMEALASLSPEGQRRWEEAVATICEFFANAGLPFKALKQVRGDGSDRAVGR